MTERKDEEEFSLAEFQGEIQQRITAGIFQHVGTIAQACGAKTIFAYLEAVGPGPLPFSLDPNLQVVHVCKTREEEEMLHAQGRPHLRVPNVPLTRLGQIKIAIFLGLSRGLIRKDDVVLFIAGLSGTGTLDTVFVSMVGKEFEMLSLLESEGNLPQDILPGVLDRILEIAVAISREGREGKPSGALFVIGDTARVASLSRQLILNPFRGYSEEERNVMNPALEETIKELATLDGAFVLSGDGVIETCGSYLKAASQEDFELPRGLGARHHAAAAITSLTQSLAITVSESTGMVRAFRGGKMLLEIERPYRLGVPKRPEFWA